MTTNNSVDSGLSGTTGSGNFVGSTSPAITTPSITTAINDTNGNKIINFSAGITPVNYVTIYNASTTNSPQVFSTGTDTNIGLNLIAKGSASIALFSNSAIALTATNPASPVNYVQVDGSATGQPCTINVTGTDSNIILNLGGKGTGGAAVQGTSTNDNAAAGYVGETITSNIASGSAVTATSNAAADVTSISLTAGDWMVYANVTWVTLGTTPVAVYCWTSTTSATLPDDSHKAGFNSNATLAAKPGFNAPTQRYSLASTTTVYLSGYLGNTSGNGTMCGTIVARRVR